MLRIYADFNNMDAQDRVRLNTTRSPSDSDGHPRELEDNLRVLLYMTDEFEVEANVVFADKIWRGIPDWSTIRYLDSPETSGEPVR
jgi:hypothetical protein